MHALWHVRSPPIAARTTGSFSRRVLVRPHPLQQPDSLTGELELIYSFNQEKSGFPSRNSPFRFPAWPSAQSPQLARRSPEVGARGSGSRSPGETADPQLKRKHWARCGGCGWAGPQALTAHGADTAPTARPHRPWEARRAHVDWGGHAVSQTFQPDRHSLWRDGNTQDDNAVHGGQREGVQGVWGKDFVTCFLLPRFFPIQGA